MKKILSFFMVLAMAYPAWGNLPDDSKTEEALKANVVDFRDWLMQQLSQFPKGEAAKSFRAGGYAYVPKRQACFTANQYNQAAKSDWVKSQVLQGLSVLSQQLANTAGTAFAGQSAGQLQQYAVQLQQSDDPQFQQVGTLYGQEAQALQAGNVQGADQAAVQVAAVPAPSVSPGYQPTSAESSLAQTFNQVIGTVIAGLAGVLGTMAVAQVLQALGLPALSSLLGTGQVLGTSVATGTSTGTALTNAGNSTIQTGGSTAFQQLGTVNVKQLQTQGSANAGGPPPAQ